MSDRDEWGTFACSSFYFFSSFLSHHRCSFQAVSTFGKFVAACLSKSLICIRKGRAPILTFLRLACPHPAIGRLVYISLGLGTCCFLYEFSLSLLAWISAFDNTTLAHGLKLSVPQRAPSPEIIELGWSVPCGPVELVTGKPFRFFLPENFSKNVPRLCVFLRHSFFIFLEFNFPCSSSSFLSSHWNISFSPKKLSSQKELCSKKYFTYLVMILRSLMSHCEIKLPQYDFS